ncbi:amino acid adenylation domain-containing protein [Streptacidiphilus sp. MAP12-33]|uniref:amino acid adenylation domain-containing protein n=1 Tax=Streptacidiphilus sp. MAP12-33 TaxID=3156266 RepID=UPI003516216A
MTTTRTLRPAEGAERPPAAFTVALATLLHRFLGRELTVRLTTADGTRSGGLAAVADATLMARTLAEVVGDGATEAGTADDEPELHVLFEAAEGPTSRMTVEVAEHLDDGVLTDLALARVEHLLAEAARHPGLPLARLSAVTPRDLVRLAELSAPPAGPEPRPGLPEQPVHALVAAAATARPDAVAVAEGERTVSYGQLLADAEAVAARLARAGAEPGTLVGLMADRGIAAVTALLAVSMTGAAVLPLDPAYPGPRLAHMLDDSRIVAVLVPPQHRDRLPQGLPDVVRVLDLTAGGTGGTGVTGAEDSSTPGAHPQADSPAGSTEGSPAGSTDGSPDGSTDGADPVGCGPADLATVIFTSGSTGRPKGVEVTHQGITRLVGDSTVIGITEDDVVLQYAPLTFDACLLEIWGALARGARLEIAPPGPLGLSELADVIQEQRVTVLWLTAGLFHQVSEYEPQCLGSVRRLFVGGDVVSPHHVRRVLDRWPGLEVVNGYGPTENTTFTCCHPMRAETAPTGTSVPIGRAVHGTGVHLLDDYGQLLPPGVPGELCTSGAGLARGYAGRADLTAERFVTATTGPLAGVRMYRTGDLAVHLPDGALDFLGRRDLQVKVNGFRVELPEIEAALLACAPVRQACVCAEPDGLGGKRLAAFVVVQQADALGDRQPVREAALHLRGALREQLPAYLVPARIEVLDALPLTANGKVDRARLTAATSAAPAATHAATNQ